MNTQRIADSQFATAMRLEGFSSPDFENHPPGLVMIDKGSDLRLVMVLTSIQPQWPPLPDQKTLESFVEMAKQMNRTTWIASMPFDFTGLVPFPFKFEAYPSSPDS